MIRKDRSSSTCNMGHSAACRSKDGMEEDSMQVVGSRLACAVRGVGQVQSSVKQTPWLVWMELEQEILTSP